MKKHKIVASLLLSTALLGSTVLTTASNVGAETIQLGTQKEVTDDVKLSKNISNLNEVVWEVSFNTEKWRLGKELNGKGYYYFFLPRNVEIKGIKEKLINGYEKVFAFEDYIKQFPEAKLINFETNREAFDAQWGWSVGLIDNEKTYLLKKLKENGDFHQVFITEGRSDQSIIKWTLAGTVIDGINPNEVPFIAAIKRNITFLGPSQRAALVADYPNIVPNPQPRDSITVTVKGGENSEITDLDFRYYIYQGNFKRTISAGTTLAEFLKEIAIKEAPLDNDRKPNDVILKKGYKVSKWVDDKNNVIQSDTVLSDGMSLTPIVEPKEKPESTPAPHPETPKAPSTPEKPMVDPKVSETEKPGTPEQPEVPAPSPSPESPKKEDMAPNKTKDEVYEPIVQTDKWVVYPVGISKEEAEKKILDAVTVPKEAGETKKEIVGDVPLAAGQYGVNVKVIYDDKSYDITLVDVHVTSNQTDKQNEDMPQSPEQPRMSEMPKVEPKVEEMKPEVMPEIPEQPREPKGPEMPSPAPEQPKTPEVPDMSQPEVPKSETPKMEQPEVVPPTPESEKPLAPMKPETSSPEGPETPPTPAPEQPRVPEMSETPAPSPAPESPKKEEMVPNKTKDELYEPIVSMVDWVAYPVGTSKEVAEKKILDAVTVPQEAGPVTKEVVGDVPLVEGQYGVNVKVIYDDHSYDVVLVDVRVTKEKSHMDMPQPEAPKKETPKQEQPEMVIPEEKMPKADNPKQGTPKLEQPKVEIPKEETPKIEVPKESEKEKSDIQKMAKPKQENQMAKESQKTDNPSEKMKPKSQGAKITSPAVKQPMAEMSDGKKPQKSKETLPNTGEAGGSLTWLGAALATLSTFVYVFKNKKKEE
ncbi:TPA: LPXTG cell wall anchor domain-containing protein [Streptococcus suis]|nr:LPXTG cell wall anchor domain-containing protein [Streptococcus suis]